MQDPTFSDFAGRDPRQVRILWPSRGWVSAEKIKTWASDAYSNEAPMHVCCACGRDVRSEDEACAHDADSKPVWDDGTMEPVTFEDATELLDSLGLVTFARGGVR